MSGIVRHYCLRGVKGSSSLLKATCAARARSPTNTFKLASANSRELSRSSTAMSSRTDRPRSNPWYDRNEEDYRKLPNLPIPGDPLDSIRACVYQHKNKKWGFLIYRCDYSSDETWAKFLSIIDWHMSHALEILEATDLLPSMEMTAKEDRETLDGASVDQVREIFKNWVLGEEGKEELRDAPYNGYDRYPRYTYCIHVDADVLDSVVNRAPPPPKHDHDRIGYVNLVRIRLQDMIPDCGSYDYEEEELDGEEDDFDEDEKYHDLVKAPILSLSPENYGYLFDYTFFARMRDYRRRDDGVSLH